MNRFDRVTSILLLLQTRSVITAQFLSEHFDVSERTIYRDIRTLENAAVPIGSEAGLGYFLQKGYRLPPVSFTLDEASSLLLGEKLLVSSLDANTLRDFNQALNKIKAVVDHSDKDYLTSFDADIEVLPTGSQFPAEDIPPQASGHDDLWLRESRSALVQRQVVEIDYAAISNQHETKRSIEPIGLFYYSWHWHLIAWCRLREGYRDFRLDRIVSFIPQTEKFSRHNRLTLQQYLDSQTEREDLVDVELIFGPQAARFVQEQRFLFGFVDEEEVEGGVKMRFLTHIAEYMARWLLQFTHDVIVIKGDVIKAYLQQFSAELAVHWQS